MNQNENNTLSKYPLTSPSGDILNDGSCLITAVQSFNMPLRPSFSWLPYFCFVRGRLSKHSNTCISNDVHQNIRNICWRMKCLRLSWYYYCVLHVLWESLVRGRRQLTQLKLHTPSLTRKVTCDAFSSGQLGVKTGFGCCVKPRPNDRNMSTQHCWAQHVARVWPPVATCSDILGVVGSNLTILSQQHPTRRNTAQRCGQTRAACCAQQCCDM